MSQYKRLSISLAGSGTRSIVPKPAAGNLILIFEIYLIPDVDTGLTTAVLQDTSPSPVEVMGGAAHPLPLTSDTPLIRPFHHIPCIVTSKGEGLDVVLGTGNFSGHVVFAEVPDSVEIAPCL